MAERGAGASVIAGVVGGAVDRVSRRLERRRQIEERITLAEARSIRLKAAAELLPYLHGKMPTVELQPDEKLPMLIIELGTNQMDIDRGRIDGGQREGALSVGLPLLENQGVSADGAPSSHGVTVSRIGESVEDQGFAEDESGD